MHVSPSGVHWAVHTPLTHELSQQSESWLQLSWFAAQPASHTLFVQD